MADHTDDDIDASAENIDSGEDQGPPASAIERAQMDARRRLKATREADGDTADLLVASQTLTRHRQDLAEIREQYQRAQSMLADAQLTERVLQGVVERRAGIDDAAANLTDPAEDGENEERRKDVGE